MKSFKLLRHLSVALCIVIMSSVAQAKSLAHDSSYQVHDPVLAKMMYLIHHEGTSAKETMTLLQLFHEQYPEVYQLLMMEGALVVDSNSGSGTEDSQSSFGGSPGNCYHCFQGETTTREFRGQVGGQGEAGVGRGSVGGQAGVTIQRENSSINTINCVNTCKDKQKTYKFD